MSYGNYLKQLCKFVLSSSFVFGVTVGIAMLFFGEGSMNLDIDFDFGALDGLTIIVGLPLVAILVFVLLSPLSFWIYRLFPNKTDSPPPDS